jgi:hypothetical protein
MDYRQAIALLFAGLAVAADREPTDVLERAKAKVLANYRSIHSYTCLETIQRDYYQPWAATLPRQCSVLMKLREDPTPDLVLQLGSRDRLRLDVATGSKGEIHSWPGASRFADAGIETLVRDGPIGTGAFATLLSLLFLQDVKKFGYAGSDELAGSRRLIYTFSVPASDSHYRIKSADRREWLLVGYEGVVFVDAETADPVRVTVSTKDLPPAVGICQSTSTLEFRRDTGVSEELLLPVSAAQRFVNPNGSETQNTTTFSNCRQYSSESTITYYASSDDTATVRRVAAKSASPDIPEWIPFTMELLTTIDSDTAAAGDRFTARLTSAIRDGRRTIAPKGALIEGRVSNVEVGYWPLQGVMIGLTPESLEVHGVRIPFAARLDLSKAVVAQQQKHRKGLYFVLPQPGEIPQQVHLPGTHNLLKKGYSSNWLTAKVRGERFTEFHAQ